MKDDSTASDTAVGEEIPSAFGSRAVSVGTVFEVLSDRHRRYVLYTLQEEGSLTLAELGESVAAWEYGVPVDELDEDQHRRICAALHHTHIPHLVDVNAVEYDAESGVVSLDRIEPLEDLLEVAAKLER